MTLAPSAKSRPLLLIDGFNLLHSVILQGRDRVNWWLPEKQSLVVDYVGQCPGEFECWLVFDSSRSDEERPALPVSRTQRCNPARILYAPSADDAIVSLCELHQERRVQVASADRALQDRCRNHGAVRLRPWDLQELFAAPRKLDPNGDQ